MFPFSIGSLSGVNWDNANFFIIFSKGESA